MSVLVLGALGPHGFPCPCARSPPPPPSPTISCCSLWHPCFCHCDRCRFPSVLGSDDAPFVLFPFPFCSSCASLHLPPSSGCLPVPSFVGCKGVRVWNSFWSVRAPGDGGALLGTCCDGRGRGVRECALITRSTHACVCACHASSARSGARVLLGWRKRSWCARLAPGSGVASHGSSGCVQVCSQSW